MGVDIYQDGALEPVRSIEPFHATYVTLLTCTQNGVEWLQISGADTEHPEILNISKIQRIRKNDISEAS